MTDLTREQLEALLDGATQGPWQADGEPWNRVVWSSAENRVCFMAHSNGLDDARDIATSNLVAAAPDLARQLLATMDALAEAQAAQAGVVERACLAVSEQADWPEDEHGRTEQPELFARVINAIRSLADPTGVKMLADLRARAERAEAELQRFHEERAYVIGANDGWDAAAEQGEASPAVSKAMVRFWKKLAETHNSRAERAEAERDRLASANAAQGAKETSLVRALETISSTDSLHKAQQLANTTLELLQKELP